MTLHRLLILLSGALSIGCWQLNPKAPRPLIDQVAAPSPTEDRGPTPEKSPTRAHDSPSSVERSPTATLPVSAPTTIPSPATSTPTPTAEPPDTPSPVPSPTPTPTPTGCTQDRPDYHEITNDERAICRFLGNGKACEENCWAAAVYDDVHARAAQGKETQTTVQVRFIGSTCPASGTPPLLAAGARVIRYPVQIASLSGCSACSPATWSLVKLTTSPSSWGFVCNSTLAP